MAISIDQEIKNQSKCKQFVVYTGSSAEGLTLDQMSLRAVFDRALLIDDTVVSALEDQEVVVSIFEIEQQFPGTVQRLTAIADWLNPANPTGYKPPQ